MSLDSWEREFIPFPPRTAAHRGRRAALIASLRFWTGLLSKNRRKHHIIIRDGHLMDPERREFFWPQDADALCWRYYRGKYPPCKNCPVLIVKGESCYDSEERSSFYSRSDARPMLRLLKKAAKKYGIPAD